MNESQLFTRSSVFFGSDPGDVRDVVERFAGPVRFPSPQPARAMKSTPEPRDFAVRTAIHAFYSDSELLIVADVEPSPEFVIDILQVPTDEERGVLTFQLIRRRRPGTFEMPPSRTPFRCSEIFGVGRFPESVLVRHAAGYDEVAVDFTRQDLLDVLLGLSDGDVEVNLPDPTHEHDDDHGPIPPPPPHAAPLAAERPEPRPTAVMNPAGNEQAGILSDITVRHREAIGYSNKLSFDEAFADAIKKLPPASVKFPDMMETVEVVHIGASFGGIAGFHRLEVRVRAYPD